MQLVEVTTWAGRYTGLRVSLCGFIVQAGVRNRNARPVPPAARALAYAERSPHRGRMHAGIIIGGRLMVFYFAIPDAIAARIPGRRGRPRNVDKVLHDLRQRRQATEYAAMLTLSEYLGQNRQK